MEPFPGVPEGPGRLEKGPGLEAGGSADFDYVSNLLRNFQVQKAKGPLDLWMTSDASSVNSWVKETLLPACT